MKKSIKTNLRIALALFALVLFTAGCGGGGDDDFFGDDFNPNPIPVNVPNNGPPLLLAQFDAYDTDVDTILFVDELFGILANDEYPVFDTVIEAPLFTVQGGDLEVFPDGSFEYEPQAGFTGDDSFEYTIRDTATGRTSTAQVFISVTVPTF